MKIGIIGAGNMGGAIARGIARSGMTGIERLTVSSPNNHGELDAIVAEFPAISTTTDNCVAAIGADIVIIAVKPWILDDVMREISPKTDFSRQIIASVVAGVPLSHYAEFAPAEAHPAIFRIIPNTAITVGESMTFIAQMNASTEQIDTISSIFDKMGKLMLVEEKLMGAGTALASCGIAYVMRYVRAATEGGVELGMRAADAKAAMLQTLIGAARLLEATGNNPEAEIDKVTTPGGLTIKGLNAMERFGFTTAVIEGLKASCK